MNGKNKELARKLSALSALAYVRVCNPGPDSKSQIKSRIRESPSSGGASLLGCLWLEQRCRHPSLGRKEKEERAADSTVTHIRIVYESIWAVNIGVFRSIPRIH